MSEELNANGSAPSASTEPSSTVPAETVPDAKSTETSADATNRATESADAEVDNVKTNIKDKEITDKSAQEPSSTEDKPAEDAEMKGEEDKTNGDSATGEASAAARDASAAKDKSRRKSGGVPEHKKKLNRKQSKAKITHTDAKPGDYFYVQMKGHPSWPAIICNEDMLPSALLSSRPVSAQRPDGTWREDYADGGKNINGRTFPVMYLYTNEFSWTVNTALVDLDLETIGDTPETKRKDLYQACMVAAEKHDLDYFKQLLQDYVDQQEAEKAEREAEAEAKKAKKANKNKRKSQATVDEEPEDVDMVDAPNEAAGEGSAEEKPAKKRKTSVEETPKPKKSIKVKLNPTPKAANGTGTPKSTKKEKAESAAKPKSTKKAAAKKSDGETSTPAKVEDTRTPEEIHKTKEKEVMFLRHKLQKGLLAKDDSPKESDMKAMSEYVTKLESYADLEVSIIRSTKINKVLKAIIKLPAIPLEDEFHFKDRSSSLLNKWNQILDSAPESAATNGNGEKKAASEEVSAAVEAKAETSAPEEKKGEQAEEMATEDATEETERVLEPVAESKEADADTKMEDATPATNTVEDEGAAVDVPAEA